MAHARVRKIFAFRISGAFQDNLWSALQDGHPHRNLNARRVNVNTRSVYTREGIRNVTDSFCY